MIPQNCTENGESSSSSPVLNGTTEHNSSAEIPTIKVKSKAHCNGTISKKRKGRKRRTISPSKLSAKRFMSHVHGESSGSAIKSEMIDTVETLGDASPVEVSLQPQNGIAHDQSELLEEKVNFK